MEDLKFYEDKMNKTLDVLVSDYAAIRAGRANPHVLEVCRYIYGHLAQFHEIPERERPAD